MLEAVNSTVLNANIVRVETAKVAPERSYTVNPERIQEIGAKFVSPYIVLDGNFDKAIFTIRDSSTGDVLRQYPTESQIRAYQRSISQHGVTIPEPREDIVVAPQETLDPVVLSAPAAQVAEEVAPLSAPVAEAVAVATQASGGAAQTTFSTTA